MKVRGRNGKWLGTGNRGAVQKTGVSIVSKLSPRIRQGGGRNDALVVVDIVEYCTGISQHKCVGGKNRGRSGRGSIYGKERMDGGKLAADFLFLNVEETSNMLDHLLMGESQFFAGGTVWGRRGHNIGSTGDTIGRGQRARWDKDGGR